MTTTTVQAPISLLDLVGQPLGVSSWHQITQHQVNMFAEATGDRQWIHTDPVRAAAGPFGGPIAHGYLTLALAQQRPAGIEAIFTVVFELDGSDRPACVAEVVVIYR